MSIPHHVSSSTNEILFNLVFGIEMVISVEIGLPTLRTEHFDKLSNLTCLLLNLDLLDETRDKIHLRIAVY